MSKSLDKRLIRWQRKRALLLMHYACKLYAETLGRHDRAAARVFEHTHESMCGVCGNRLECDHES